MEEQATAAAPRELPLEFRATGAEYFRIWIVNLLLTIITIGIYSAWAKVRRLRYFYGSTSLDGTSFEYHGKPIPILKGRLIAVGAYLVFFARRPLVAGPRRFVLLPLVIFGVPWIIMKARLFQMRMSSWRGLRFNFHGDYMGALGAYIGWSLLAAITIMILWPCGAVETDPLSPGQWCVWHGTVPVPRHQGTVLQVLPGRAGTVVRGGMRGCDSSWAACTRMHPELLQNTRMRRRSRPPWPRSRPWVPSTCSAAR